MMEWITNCPKDAEALRKADKAYADAREEAKGLPLPEKIVALRDAKNARTEAYAGVMRQDHLVSVRYFAFFQRSRGRLVFRVAPDISSRPTAGCEYRAESEDAAKQLMIGMTDVVYCGAI